MDDRDKKMEFPLLGGLNTSFISVVDFNNDKINDIIVSDMKSRIAYFFQQDDSKPGNYSFKPRYNFQMSKSTFQYPPFFVDYNFDGVLDIIELSSFINVFKGSKIDDSTYSYTKVYDKLMTENMLRDNPFIFSYPLFNLPAFVDIDSDGDMDMISNDYLGWTVLYKNFAAERGLSKDSLDLVRFNKSYGQHAISFNPMVFIENFHPEVVSGKSNNPPLRQRHEVSPYIWLMDINNDNKLDAVASMENSLNAPLGLNSGTPDSAHFRHLDTLFPFGPKPIQLFAHHGTHADIDADGRKDLIITPMMERDNMADIKDKIYNHDRDNIFWYKNVGKHKIPNRTALDSFEYQGSFLPSREMIDVGTEARPLLYDLDLDGDLDLLIANKFLMDSLERAQIFYYQNIGTKKNPSFKLTNTDLFGLKAQNFYDITLSSFDYNGDGTKDLYISYYRLGSIRNQVKTNLVKVINTQTKTFSDDSFTVDNFFFRNTVNQPFFYDWDGDGLEDLIEGGLFDIIWFKNIGTKQKAVFSKSSNTLYTDGITDAYFYHLTYGRDTIGGQPSLFVCYKGRFRKAKKVNNALVIEDRDLIQDNFGFANQITSGDINDDGNLEVIFGSASGGIQLYSFINLDNLVYSINDPNEFKEISLYPNPATDEITVDLSNSSIDLSLQKIQYRVYDMLSRLQLQGETRLKESISVSNLEPGLYFISFIFEDSIKTLPLKITKP
jgi:hypothetical protein